MALNVLSFGQTSHRTAEGRRMLVGFISHTLFLFKNLPAVMLWLIELKPTWSQYSIKRASKPLSFLWGQAKWIPFVYFNDFTLMSPQNSDREAKPIPESFSCAKVNYVAVTHYGIVPPDHQSLSAQAGCTGSSSSSAASPAGADLCEHRSCFQGHLATADGQSRFPSHDSRPILEIRTKSQALYFQWVVSPNFLEEWTT